MWEVAIRDTDGLLTQQILGSVGSHEEQQISYPRRGRKKKILDVRGATPTQSGAKQPITPKAEVVGGQGGMDKNGLVRMQLVARIRIKFSEDGEITRIIHGADCLFGDIGAESRRRNGHRPQARPAPAKFSGCRYRR